MKPSVPLLRLFSALPSSWVTTSVNSGPHSGSLSTQVYQLLLSGACEDRTARLSLPTELETLYSHLFFPTHNADHLGVAFT